jgi:hypothetical protein
LCCVVLCCVVLCCVVLCCVVVNIEEIDTTGLYNGGERWKPKGDGRL